MASPFQQQVRQRKLLYLGLIVVLLTLSVLWRKGVTDVLAKELAIRSQSRGEVELTGAVVRLGLTGSRGVATCILWANAIEKQKKNQWNEMEVLVRSLTKLQPHFITPWLFQSWNLAYNVSVESDRVRDKYFYVTRGIELLAEGERQNANHPDLRWSIGFYLQHKINMSDETNYKRSLFQLTLIPPNERDPRRFQKQVGDEVEFNWVAFEEFCRAHPQLVRRLTGGMLRENVRDRKQQFRCESAQDVVRFLEDNYNVPSIYQEVKDRKQTWDPQAKDVALLSATRFPPLPPRDRPPEGPTGEPKRPFDTTALTSESSLGDDVDGYSVSHSWFCYAQEPLPLPDPEMPGASMPITDPARQRRPKHMTTLLFRNYPAMGTRYMAERLQQEGWFDGEGWDARELFAPSQGAFSADTSFVYGKDRPWSRDAWVRSDAAWRFTGERNHLWLADQARLQNLKEDGARFAERWQINLSGMPPPLRDEDLKTPQEKREYEAAKFMFEYEFYRQLSNFQHHFQRAGVEARDATIVCRKLFARAEALNADGSPIQALEIYGDKRKEPSVDGWRDKEMTVLEAWRDLVLLENREFRRDNFVQETTAEYEIRYLRLLDSDPKFRQLKRDIAKASAVLPLLPSTDPETFKHPLLRGPFQDFKDKEGQPLVSEMFRDVVLERMGLLVRPSMAPPGGAAPPPGMPPPRGNEGTKMPKGDS